MATLNTLQILQKNTLASLQSLIDFTNASFPTSGANHPTLGASHPTPKEDSLTLSELRPLLQKFHMLDPTLFNVIRLFVASLPDENPLRKLGPIFSEIQEFHHTEQFKHTPLVTEEPETEATNTTLPVHEPEEEEEDNTEIITYIRPTECFVQSPSGTLTDDQKRYYSLICGQNWKELASMFMTELSSAFVPLEHNEPLNYNMLMHSDPTPKTYVSSSEEYMFLIRCAIENRKIIGNILLPESNILWEHMPKEFMKECNEYYKRNMLFRPATMKYDILTDALKIYRYCKNPSYHTSWTPVVSSQVTLTDDQDIQTLIRDWIQGRSVSDYYRDQIMTLLIVSNFAKEVSSPSALAKNYYGSNEFSQLFLKATDEDSSLPQTFKAWATGGITFKKLKNVLTGLGIQQVRRAEGQRYQGLRCINKDKQPNVMSPIRIREPEAYMPGSGFFGITDDRELNLGVDSDTRQYTVLEGFDKPPARIAQPHPYDEYGTLTQSIARKEEIKPVTNAFDKIFIDTIIVAQKEFKKKTEEIRQRVIEMENAKFKIDPMDNTI